MELFSLQFALFMGASLAGFYLLGAVAPKRQWVALLAASLGFYCLMGSWQTLAFVGLTAVVTWASARAMRSLDNAAAKAAAELPAADPKDKAARKERKARVKALKARALGRKRLVLLAALLVCFGVLAYLKYWNTILYQLGLAASRTSLGLLLPLGISFYTFQSVGYVVDAYNAKLEPEPNLARHLLFMTWFPQMIQGPINRYDTLAPQLFAPHRASEADLPHALVTFDYGLLKKLVMADLLVDIITRLLSGYGADTPGSVAVLAILMYSAQQYGDFSGGIDMVEGASELFGIRMSTNFRRPYFSTSLADFWRRWHITLGQWMRDYVFYPFALTGAMKRLGKWATSRAGRHVGRILPACVANILVFLIVGVWHGADFHFVAWGLYNGVVIALADLCRPLFERANAALGVNRNARTRAAHHVWAVVRTFVVVNVGWYFDRIEDVSLSLLALRNTVCDFDLAGLGPALAAMDFTPAQKMQVALACVAALVVFVASLWEERTNARIALELGEGVPFDEKNVATMLPGLSLGVRSLVYVAVGLLIACSFILGVGGGFMYANY